MNKQFSYDGFTFNTKVDLNVKQSANLPNGKKHQVTVTDMGDCLYHEKLEFEESFLLEGIEEMEKSAKNWVDQINHKTPKSKIEQELTALGFK